MNPLYNTLFILPISTGPIFILVGLIMYKFPPKNINSFYGYRTSNSMESKEKWDFAQTYSAKKMIIYGAVYTLTSLIGLVFNPHQLIGFLISMLLLVFTVVLLILNVEKELKNRFK